MRPPFDESRYSVLVAVIAVSAALWLVIHRRRRRELLSRPPEGTFRRTKTIVVPPRVDSSPPATPLAHSAREAIADPELREHLAHGRTISAIKRYRDLTGVGLREAKEMIESLG
jgi:hypothetical protein